MPYESESGRFEKASKLGQTNIVNNDLVQSEIGEFEAHKPDTDEIPIERNSVDVDSLGPAEPRVQYVISIDGSRSEPETDKSYPENRIGFIQLATVLTKLREVRVQTGQKFVDPREVREIAESSLTQVVLPSTNHRYGDAADTHESWRAKTFDIFTDEDREFVPDATLFEYFHKLLMDSPRYENGQAIIHKCPNPDCDAGEQRIPSDAPGECSNCGTSIFPTDTLRVWERVSNHQPNLSALNVLMNIMEHLILGAFLDFFAEKDPEFLQHLGIIKDGPLAQFDTGYWIYGPILRRIHDVYDQQNELGYEPPVIVGVAKTGHFAQHADHVQERMPKNSALSMDDEYIYEYVVTSRSAGQQFGEKTYYGTNFIYNSPSERIFAVTIPRERDAAGDITYDPHAYPTLSRTADLLSEVETALYENSLIPVALANRYASIPVQTGSKVLAEFVNSVLDEGSNSL